MCGILPSTNSDYQTMELHADGTGIGMGPSDGWACYKYMFYVCRARESQVDMPTSIRIGEGQYSINCDHFSCFGGTGVMYALLESIIMEPLSLLSASCASDVFTIMIPIAVLVVAALIAVLAGGVGGILGGVHAFVRQRVMLDRMTDNGQSAADLPQKGNHHRFTAQFPQVLLIDELHGFPGMPEL